MRGEAMRSSPGIKFKCDRHVDPYGLPSVLQMLQSLNPQDSSLALMFATHPDPSSRLDALERAIGARLDPFASQPQAAERYGRFMQGK